MGAARNANRVLKHVAVGNTALWSLDFIFLIKNIYIYMRGRMEEHIWDVGIMVWVHVLHQNLPCAYLNATSKDTVL